jgi:maltose alpha-D-glucosyltransferase/alpha-amylase
MRYDWRNNSVLCLHNLSAEPKEVRLSVHAEGEDSSTLANLLSEDHSYPEKQGKHCILLEPYGYRWFRIGGLDYLLKRSAV